MLGAILVVLRDTKDLILMIFGEIFMECSWIHKRVPEVF